MCLEGSFVIHHLQPHGEFFSSKLPFYGLMQEVGLKEIHFSKFDPALGFCMSLWFRPCYFYAFVLVKVENWLCVFWKKLIIMLLDSDPSLEGTIQPLETGNYFFALGFY